MTASWTSRSMGTRLQHGIFYALIRIGGVRVAYALLFWVTLWYLFKPEAIRRNAPYLERRFLAAGPFMRLLHRWRRQWAFGKALIDRAAVGIRGGEPGPAHPEDLSTIQALHKEGKGVILLTAHVGNWQMALSVLPRHMPGRASIVMHHEAGNLDRHYFEHSGEQPSFGIIDPARGPESAVAMVQTLFRGELLTMMGDRTFGTSQSCRVSFLGADITLPYAPYYLASVTGAPVIIFFSFRDGQQKVCTRIARVIRVPAGLGKNPAAYLEYAQLFAKTLEQSTQTHPYQFFNFYNMWDCNGH